ncbi:MAG: hypothetical protein ACRD12_24075 [Acidimicrobiales bacterium]
MIAPRLAAELVVQTATALLVGGLAPREAVTILATQAPQARATAGALVEEDAGRAGTYSELLRSLANDLGGQVEASDDPKDLRAAIAELQRVAEALSP